MFLCWFSRVFVRFRYFLVVLLLCMIVFCYCFCFVLLGVDSVLFVVGFVFGLGYFLFLCFVLFGVFLFHV